MGGWTNYFRLGPVTQSYRFIDCYTTTRLRRWLCKKHKQRSKGLKRYPDALEAHVRFDERDVETGFMVRTVRHRQSKEAETDMPDLQNYRATSRLYPFSKRPPY
ncbi:hypothetical protein C6Y61_22935 [Salmonella enterica]|nr:hypothetical protein [Salmonella enterica]EBP3563902.1 hypothetical protein [Salmonella enterica subsp. enterica]EDT1320205.1 hypothetical protein [Salmonella enterica subsp. enterica serovar Mississippi]EAX9069614.1 hypothetical protein [Salmonella enterica]EBI7611000.1 hypothetical protein [Salmonella enterica]